jgi:molybdate transport system ATP-binding protein
VQARDVSLSLQAEHQSSILNRLPVTINALAEAAHSAHLLVSLDADGTPLLARITRYSAAQLGIAPGLKVWAQIKSVAVVA